MSVFNETKAYHDSNGHGDGKVSEYGEPKYSLYTSKKILTLHAEITVTNSEDEVVYTSTSKALSLHDATSIVDKENNEIAKMEKKMFSLHAKHMVTMADGTSFELSSEILHIAKKITNIEGLGWQLRGSFVELEFELLDETGKVISIIGRKMISAKEKYCVDIYKPEHEKLIIAILITLEHMIIDQQNARAAGSGAGAGAITIHSSIN